MAMTSFRMLISMNRLSTDENGADLDKPVEFCLGVMDKPADINDVRAIGSPCTGNPSLEAPQARSSRLNAWGWQLPLWLVIVSEQQQSQRCFGQCAPQMMGN
jgi:hypothetical protein